MLITVRDYSVQNGFCGFSVDCDRILIRGANMKGYRKVLIAMNGSADVVREGIKLAQDEKTWVTVLKVIPENEGDLNLTGIKNIEDVLDSGARKALAGAWSAANTAGALIKTRLE